RNPSCAIDSSRCEGFGKETFRATVDGISASAVLVTLVGEAITTLYEPTGMSAFCACNRFSLRRIPTNIPTMANSRRLIRPTIHHIAAAVFARVGDAEACVLMGTAFVTTTTIGAA